MTSRWYDEQMKAHEPGSFVYFGMLTDSRSFRHIHVIEYLEELCDLIGDWSRTRTSVDFDALGEIVSGICCYNAKDLTKL